MAEKSGGSTPRILPSLHFTQKEQEGTSKGCGGIQYPLQSRVLEPPRKLTFPTRAKKYIVFEGPAGSLDFPLDKG